MCPSSSHAHFTWDGIRSGNQGELVDLRSHHYYQGGKHNIKVTISIPSERSSDWWSSQAWNFEWRKLGISPCVGSNILLKNLLGKSHAVREKSYACKEVLGRLSKLVSIESKLLKHWRKPFLEHGFQFSTGLEAPLARLIVKETLRRNAPVDMVRWKRLCEIYFWLIEGKFSQEVSRKK